MIKKALNIVVGTVEIGLLFILLSIIVKIIQTHLVWVG
jgi:hypothetical protein